MKRVLVDVDGVLADFVTSTLEELIEIGGPRMAYEDIKTWDMFSCIPHAFHEGLLTAWRRPGFCAGLDLYPGVVEAIDSIRDVAEVVFVTAPMPDAPHWMWERNWWLKRHFGATERDVVFAVSKHLVVGDVLVDDKTSNVVSWTKHHPQGLGVLWTQPYNRHDVGERLLHTDSWAEVESLVRR